jgi:hypothetical protein
MFYGPTALNDATGTDFFERRGSTRKSANQRQTTWQVWTRLGMPCCAAMATAQGKHKLLETLRIRRLKRRAE